MEKREHEDDLKPAVSLKEEADNFQRAANKGDNDNIDIASSAKPENVDSSVVLCDEVSVMQISEDCVVDEAEEAMEQEDKDADPQESVTDCVPEQAKAQCLGFDEDGQKVVKVLDNAGFYNKEEFGEMTAGHMFLRDIGMLDKGDAVQAKQKIRSTHERKRHMLK